MQTRIVATQFFSSELYQNTYHPDAFYMVIWINILERCKDASTLISILSKYVKFKKHLQVYKNSSNSSVVLKFIENVQVQISFLNYEHSQNSGEFFK